MSTAAPTIKTTKVIGFFNPNEWPVSIHSSQLGLNNLTIPKGGYVTDTQGNKINDPRLSSYVGPNMLATEFSDEPVPVREIVPPGDRRTAMESPGFTSSPTVPASMRPPAMSQTSRVAAVRAAMNVKAPSAAPSAAPKPAAAPAPPPRQMTSVTTGEPAPATHNPVKAMSMADARRLGLVAGTVTPAPEGLPDNDNKEVAKAAPFIGYARDGSLRGRPAARPPTATVPAAPGKTVSLVGARGSGVNAPQPPPPVQPERAPDTPPAQAAFLPGVEVRKGGIAESMAEEAQVDADAPDVVGQVLHRVAATTAVPPAVATTAAPPPATTAAPPPATTASPSVVGDLPEPRLGVAGTFTYTAANGKFECDGRTFKNYAGLLGYVRVKHPDQLEVVKAAWAEAKKA